MNGKKSWFLPLVLLLMVLFIRWFSADADRVEQYYSTGIYPLISSVLRAGFGYLPFSLGDIIYAVVICWMLYKLTRFIRLLFRKQVTRKVLSRIFYRILVSLSILYISFNLLWGINYNRKGIASQLGIPMQKYSTAELVTIDSLLLLKVNQSKQAVLRREIRVFSEKEIYQQAADNYRLLGNTYSFLGYQNTSVKSSMWGWLGNYVGFMGYYNPFTGEAQLNTTVPRFLHPFTTSHEIAHQLGYAKENEANFTGYLAAAASTDSTFRYSVYLDLFLYAQRNLYQVDSTAARDLSKQLLPAVKADINEWRKFNAQHQGVLEPVFRVLYGAYLRQNQQPSGLLSYDEVTGFLIAYYKKFGKL